jgi:hypothetical protein
MLDLQKFCLGLNLSQNDYNTVLLLAGKCKNHQSLPYDWRYAESSLQHIYFYNSKFRQATWSHPVDYVLAIIVRDIKSLPPCDEQLNLIPAIGSDMLGVTNDRGWLLGLLDYLSITLGSDWGWIRRCVASRSIGPVPGQVVELLWVDCIDGAMGSIPNRNSV